MGNRKQAVLDVFCSKRLASCPPLRPLRFVFRRQDADKDRILFGFYAHKRKFCFFWNAAKCTDFGLAFCEKTIVQVTESRHTQTEKPKANRIRAKQTDKKPRVLGADSHRYVVNQPVLNTAEAGMLQDFRSQADNSGAGYKKLPPDFLRHLSVRKTNVLFMPTREA